MARELVSAAPEEVWRDRPVHSAETLEPADVILYPAFLRREHHGLRSALRVTRVVGRNVRVTRIGDEAAGEFVVFARQLEENGVYVVSEAAQGWVVFDVTTANLLGEFHTEAEALAAMEELRPHGRYGPDGHDLRVERWNKNSHSETA